MTTENPDTDELMLRELEAAIARTRTAMDAGQWELAKRNLTELWQQAFDLSAALNARIPLATADPMILGG